MSGNKCVSQTVYLLLISQVLRLV